MSFRIFTSKRWKMIPFQLDCQTIFNFLADIALDSYCTVPRPDSRAQHHMSWNSWQTRLIYYTHMARAFSTCSTRPRDCEAINFRQNPCWYCQDGRRATRANKHSNEDHQPRDIIITNLTWHAKISFLIFPKFSRGKILNWASAAQPLEIRAPFLLRGPWKCSRAWHTPFLSGSL